MHARAAPPPLLTPLRRPAPPPAGLGLTLLVLAGLRLGGYLEGADDGLAGGSAFGPGDAVAAALWTASLYFCSPLQLLIIFFGSFERERPSDWVLRQLGRLAGLQVGELTVVPAGARGHWTAAAWQERAAPRRAATPPRPHRRCASPSCLQVDAINYKAPAALQAATVGLFAASGLSVAYVLEAGLGDATWGVSTGAARLGLCIACGAGCTQANPAAALVPLTAVSVCCSSLVRCRPGRLHGCGHV